MKLISCNIEGNKHLDLVTSFLKREQADVVCLQEVFKADLPLLEQVTQSNSFFVALTDVVEPNPHLDLRGELGLVILSREPLQQTAVEFYQGRADHVPIFFEQQNPNALRRAVIKASIEVAAHTYQVATTHFTWSPMGSFTVEQAQDFASVSTILDQWPDLILCGDFNSPRAGKPTNIFHQLAARYQDHIPSQYLTSIDGAHHKAGPLELMVDGLFSTPHYQSSQVRFQDGVSDHQAIVAEMARVYNAATYE